MVIPTEMEQAFRFNAIREGASERGLIERIEEFLSGDVPFRHVPDKEK